MRRFVFSLVLYFTHSAGLVYGSIPDLVPNFAADVKAQIEGAVARGEITFDFSRHDEALKKAAEELNLSTAQYDDVLRQSRDTFFNRLVRDLIAGVQNHFNLRDPSHRVTRKMRLADIPKANEIIRYYDSDKFKLPVAEVPIFVVVSENEIQGELILPMYLEPPQTLTPAYTINVGQEKKELRVHEPVPALGVDEQIRILSVRHFGTPFFIELNERLLRETESNLVKTLVHELRHYFDFLTQPQIFLPENIDAEAKTHNLLFTVEFYFLERRLNWYVARPSTQAFFDFQVKARLAEAPNADPDAVRREIENKLRKQYSESIVNATPQLYGKKEGLAYREEIIFAKESLHETVDQITDAFHESRQLYRTWHDELPPDCPRLSPHFSSRIYVSTQFNSDHL